MESTEAYVETWKEIFKGFIKVKSFVVFANGSVVIFSDSQGDLETTKNAAIGLLKVTQTQEYFTIMNVQNSYSVYGWNENVLSLSLNRKNLVNLHYFV